jgi:hypothetical protein
MRAKWDGEDRRKSPRVPISAKVEVISGQNALYFFTSDVSIHGLFLACQEPLDLGRILRMQISVPGLKQLLPLQGTVVRQVKSGPTRGVGIEFLETPPEFQILLSEAIEKLSQLDSDAV